MLSIPFFRSAAFRRARTYGSSFPSTAATPAIIPRPGGTVSPNAESASRENPKVRLGGRVISRLDVADIRGRDRPARRLVDQPPGHDHPRGHLDRRPRSA